MRPFTDPAVAARFQNYPAAIRKKMLALREMVFEVAAMSEAIGELQETLKWGEPAYVTARSKSGSTVRIDWKPKTPGQYALYFNCNTDLVDTFKTLFPNDFRFEGRRAIVFGLDDGIPTDSLAFCIDASLTHHTRKRKKQALSR